MLIPSEQYYSEVLEFESALGIGLGAGVGEGAGTFVTHY